MEAQNSPEQPIAVGAMVEATNGLVGTVTGVIYDAQTNQLQTLKVQNDDESKVFTIPANLVSHQTGSRLVHLRVSRDEFLSKGAEMEVDTNTGNVGHPSPPMPE